MAVISGVEMKISIPPVGYVAIGGSCGSILRFLVTDHISSPVGTFLVNILGCIAIGILMYSSIYIGAFSRETRMFLGVGCIGSFTTFSAFASESLIAGSVNGVIYISASIISGLLAVFIGRSLVLYHRRI